MRGLEQIPSLYDLMMSWWDARELLPWRQWVTSGARGLTLEVGCGTGRNLTLYSKGVTIAAIEPSLDNLKRARGRNPDALLVQASAEALPFRDGCFDTVVSSLVFCSVPNPALGLVEVRRTLKDDGHLRMLEHVRSTSRWGARWQDFIQPPWTCFSGGCHPNRDTEGAVTQAGFTIDPDQRVAKDTLRRFEALKGAPTLSS